MTDDMASQRDLSGRRRFGSGAVSFVGRHPVGTYLVLAFAIFWASWMPVLFFGAPPRPFSATGAILGLALPAVLVTAATDGRAGVRDLLRRMLRWRVGIGWYLLATLAIPVGALLLAPLFLGSAALEGLPQNWPLLFTEFLPQLLLALVTVQVFEELGWAGFAQHRLQTGHGALKASLLVALAFAGLHLPTYVSAPISGESAIRDLSVMVIVIPFAIFFRILITFAYNRTRFSVLIAAISHASFNEASEIISPNAPGPLGQVLAFASVGLLALLAVVISKGTLAYNRDQGPVAHQVTN
jgi:membrane protease YdiL (CAAX protease family)